MDTSHSSAAPAPWLSRPWPARVRVQVVWRNRRGSTASLPLLVIRASRCCLQLLAELNEFRPVEGVLLKLHMGIGAGKLSSFYVRAACRMPHAAGARARVHTLRGSCGGATRRTKRVGLNCVPHVYVPHTLICVRVRVCVCVWCRWAAIATSGSTL